MLCGAIRRLPSACLSAYTSRVWPIGSNSRRLAVKGVVAARAGMMARAVSTAPAVLAAKEDHYGGIIVDDGALPRDSQLFQAALQHSLEEWAAQGKRGIWLKVPLSLASHIAPAADPCGFKFHHAEEDYVMMTRWLPTEESTLPPNASHQVGVGAFVVNDANEVLVVQEANGPLKGKQVWKLPTGLVNSGEDFPQAAEREVWEETGIRARFDGLLAIRQAHGFSFGKSDMWFCCALIPEPGQSNITPCAREIAAARWLPLEEYRSQEFFSTLSLHQRLMERCVAYARGQYRGFKCESLDAGIWRPRRDLLLWGEDGSEQDVEQPQAGGQHAQDTGKL